MGTRRSRLFCEVGPRGKLGLGQPGCLGVTPGGRIWGEHRVEFGSLGNTELGAAKS